MDPLIDSLHRFDGYSMDPHIAFMDSLIDFIDSSIDFPYVFLGSLLYISLKLHTLNADLRLCLFIENR